MIGWAVSRTIQIVKEVAAELLAAGVTIAQLVTDTIRHPQRRGSDSSALNELNGPLQRFNVLNVGLCLRQADHFLTVLPLAAFLEKLDTLKAFQHVALSRNGAGSF